MFECFRCLQKSAIWQSDFSFEDVGLEGEGVTSILSCSNCGSEIVVNTPEEE